jgi:hypothetical protein
VGHIHWLPIRTPGNSIERSPGRIGLRSSFYAQLLLKGGSIRLYPLGMKRYPP